MFESLSDRLSSAFRSLSGRAQLTEENIRDGLREVRLALLLSLIHICSRAKPPASYPRKTSSQTEPRGFINASRPLKAAAKDCS